jgi:hypothetical protein
MRSSRSGWAVMMMVVVVVVVTAYIQQRLI